MRAQVPVAAPEARAFGPVRPIWRAKFGRDDADAPRAVAEDRLPDQVLVTRRDALAQLLDDARASRSNAAGTSSATPPTCA